MDNQAATVALLTMAAVVTMVVWFDRRCLADLAGTPDHELRVFDRRTWALLIVVAFPIGPFLYLAYAKGPRAGA
jgi:hypothetical protein